MFSGFADINKSLSGFTSDISLSDINSKLSEIANTLSLDNLQTDGKPHSNIQQGEKQPHGATNDPNSDTHTKVKTSAPVKPSEKETHLTDLENNLLEKNNLINEQSNIILSLEQRINEYQKKFVDYDEISNENQRLKDSLRNLETKCNKFENEVQELQAKLLHSEEKCSNLSNSITSYKTHINQLENNLQNISSQYNDSEQLLLDYKTQKDQSDLQITQLKDKLNQTIAESKDSYKNLERETNTKIMKLDDIITNLRKEKESWNSRMEELMSELRQSRSNNVNPEESTSTSSSADMFYSERISQLEKDLNSCNEENSLMKIKISELELQIDQSKQTLQEKSDLEETLTKLSSEKIKLKEKLDKSIASLKGLKESTQQLKQNYEQQLEEKTNDINQLNEQIEYIQIEKKSIIDETNKKMLLLEKDYESKLNEISNQLKASITENEMNQRLYHEKQQTIQQMEIEFNNKLNETELKAFQYIQDIHKLQNTINDLNHQLSNQLNVIEVNLSSQSSYETKNNELKQQISHLNTTIEEKDAVITDQKNKIVTLTDKMKDLIQKFAEFKAKNAIFEESELKLNESIKILQSKDAEIMSMKLKYDNLQRQYDDNHMALDSIQDKYNEIQRENYRIKNDLESYQHEKELLIKDMNIIQSKCDNYHKEIEQLQQQVKQYEETIETEKALSEVNIMSLNNGYQKQINQMKEIIQQLEHNKSMYELKLREDDSISKTFDDYKKRAQIALKQANTTSTQLTTENNELKDKISQLQIELNHLMDAKNELKSEQELFIMKIEKLMQDLTISKEEVNELNRLLSYKDDELTKKEDDIKVMKDTIQSLQETITKLQSTSDKRESNSSNSNEIPDRNKPLQSSIIPQSSTNEIKDPSNQLNIPKRFLDRTSPNSSDESFEDVAIQDDFINVSFHKKSHSSSSEPLFYINQLHKQLEELKLESASRGLELTQTLSELANERELKRALAQRVDELKAFIDRSRQQQSTQESVINFEYLKTCIYRYMSTSELSEKKRLSPVISTLLKLTKEERTHIESILKEEEAAEDDLVALSNIGSSIESFFSSSSLFGSSGG